MRVGWIEICGADTFLKSHCSAVNGHGECNASFPTARSLVNGQLSIEKPASKSSSQLFYPTSACRCSFSGGTSFSASLCRPCFAKALREGKERLREGEVVGPIACFTVMGQKSRVIGNATLSIGNNLRSPLRSLPTAHCLLHGHGSEVKSHWECNAINYK